MLKYIPFPTLPAPPSWFPGHMNQFKRQLPALLKKTDVVLELRDARLPLTSINRTFEGWLTLLFIPSSTERSQRPGTPSDRTRFQLQPEGPLLLHLLCR